jgi:hypothetical protein
VKRLRARLPARLTKAAYRPPNLPPMTGDERQLADTFLEAVGRLQTSAAGNTVLAALMGDDWQDAIDALDWDGWQEVLAGIQTGLQQVIERAAQMSWHDLETLAGVPSGIGQLLGYAPERAAQLAAEHSGSLITGLTDTSRAAVQDIIGQAVRNGYSMPRTAELLKETVGLSPRYAAAVDRFHAGLTEKVGKGEMSDGQAREAVARYSGRLLDNRAETIARFEVQDSVNAGRIDGWRAAALRGSIGADATKRWVTGEDERVCPTCNDLDGVEADGGLEGTWDAGDFGEVTMPPAHPNCRCTAVISDPGTTDDGEELGGGGGDDAS